MNDEDLRTVIKVLTGKLNYEGLQWVLEEYYETIRAGKIETKEVKYEYWSEDKKAFRASATAKKVTVTVPFTPREQALLLIDSIENSTVVPHEVANAIDEKLKELLPDSRFPSIEFKPDLESVVVTPGLDESLPDTMKGFKIEFGAESRKLIDASELRSSCEKLREAISK